MGNDTLFVLLPHLGPEILNFVIFQDGGQKPYPRFSHEEGTKPQKQPCQSVCHASVIEKRHLVCVSSSSGARDMKFHNFQNRGGGHFQNRALAELAVTFERYIGAHFPL